MLIKHCKTCWLVTFAVTANFAVSPHAALAGGPVATAEEPVLVAPAPEMRPSQDWTGLYLGIQATLYSGAETVITSGADAYTFDGILGGVHVGYDRDFGQLVVGGELAFETGDIGYEFADTGGAATFSLDRSISLKLKAGFDLGRVLVYGTLGKTRATIGNTTGPDDTADGNLFGLGLTALISEKIAGGVEISKIDYDPYDSSTLFESEATTVSLRLSYRF